MQYNPNPEEEETVDANYEIERDEPIHLDEDFEDDYLDADDDDLDDGDRRHAEPEDEEDVDLDSEVSDENEDDEDLDIEIDDDDLDDVEDYAHYGPDE